MRKMLTHIVLFGSAGLAGQARATELSKSLNANDVKHAASILGFSSMHRLWTAHSLPSSRLGLDAGIETAFVFRRDLLNQGDGTAVIPRIVPVPRLWLSWDLPFDLTLSGSLAPGFLFDGISTYGAGLQWFLTELPDFDTSVSVVVHFTHVEAFGDLRTNTMGAAAQVSRDLGTWQPYAGLGLAVANIRAEATVMESGADTGPHGLLRPHLYVGTRLDFSTKLSAQLDWVGSNFSLGLLFADTF